MIDLKQKHASVPSLFITCYIILAYKCTNCNIFNTWPCCPLQLVLEGLRARQLRDALFMEKRTLEREIQQANSSLNFYDMKAARIDEQVFLSFIISMKQLRQLIFIMWLILALQLNICSEQVQRLAEEKLQSSGSLENTQKRLLDVRRLSQQARESLEESQSKVDRSRVAHLELQLELEKERYKHIHSLQYVLLCQTPRLIFCCSSGLKRKELRRSWKF